MGRGVASLLSNSSLGEMVPSAYAVTLKNSNSITAAAIHRIRLFFMDTCLPSAIRRIICYFTILCQSHKPFKGKGTINCVILAKLFHVPAGQRGGLCNPSGRRCSPSAGKSPFCDANFHGCSEAKLNSSELQISHKQGFAVASFDCNPTDQDNDGKNYCIDGVGENGSMRADGR